MVGLRELGFLWCPTLQPHEALRASTVSATSVIARVAKELQAWVLYISTDYVFDGTSPPYTPESTPNPLNKVGLGSHCACFSVPKCPVLMHAAFVLVSCFPSSTECPSWKVNEQFCQHTQAVPQCSAFQCCLVSVWCLLPPTPLLVCSLYLRDAPFQAPLPSYLSLQSRSLPRRWLPRTYQRSR